MKLMPFFARIMLVFAVAITTSTFVFSPIISSVAEQTSNELVHFFTHELVYDLKRASGARCDIARCFDNDHMSAVEFERVLENLYEKNYCLVSLEDAYEKINGKFELKKSLDFGGKNGVILSFDDLSYDTRSRGMVDKLVALEGEIFDYTASEDQPKTQRRDGVTILESFIKEHPDFSFNGARAIMCLNGYNGAFGYRVNYKTNFFNYDDEKFESEKAELQNLIDLMKEKGYQFACHTFKHCNCNYVGADRLKKDIKKWEEEIEPFVGKTNIFCYPGGVHNVHNSCNQVLKKRFDIFLCVGPDLHKKDEKGDSNAAYIYRHPLDGANLRGCRKDYEKFFDTKKIYDEKRYIPFRGY